MRLRPGGAILDKAKRQEGGYSGPNPFRIIQIQICIKTQDLKFFVFTHFREKRGEGVDTYTPLLSSQRLQ